MDPGSIVEEYVLRIHSIEFSQDPVEKFSFGVHSNHEIRVEDNWARGIKSGEKRFPSIQICK